MKQWEEKTTKLDYFSMYFIRNNKEMHFFKKKIVKNSRHKL